MIKKVLTFDQGRPNDLWGQALKQSVGSHLASLIPGYVSLPGWGFFRVFPQA